jgi:hypothetical protein
MPGVTSRPAAGNAPSASLSSPWTRPSGVVASAPRSTKSGSGSSGSKCRPWCSNRPKQTDRFRLGLVDRKLSAFSEGGPNPNRPLPTQSGHRTSRLVRADWSGRAPRQLLRKAAGQLVRPVDRCVVPVLTRVIPTHSVVCEGTALATHGKCKFIGCDWMAHSAPDLPARVHTW